MQNPPPARSAASCERGGYSHSDPAPLPTRPAARAAGRREQLPSRPGPGAATLQRRPAAGINNTALNGVYASLLRAAPQPGRAPPPP